MKRKALLIYLTLLISYTFSFPSSGHYLLLRSKPLFNSVSRDLLVKKDISMEARETNPRPKLIKRSLEADEIIKPKLNLALDFFVILMKNLVSEKGLDKAGFNLSAKNLERQLNEISAWYQTVIPKDTLLARKYRHASSMFHVMSQAFELLNFYVRDGPAHQLTRNMIELNITLLALHDSFGRPDFNRPDLGVTLSRLRNLWAIWKKSFYELQEVPQSAWLMFESRCLRAERTLDYLENYNPKINGVSFFR